MKTYNAENNLSVFWIVWLCYFLPSGQINTLYIIIVVCNAVFVITRGLFFVTLGFVLKLSFDMVFYKKV